MAKQQLIHDVAANFVTMLAGEVATQTDTKTFWISDGSNNIIVGGYGVATKSSDYTIVAKDRALVFEFTGTHTATLTAVATLLNGFSCGVFNGGSGVVTVAANGTENIVTTGGAANTLTLTAGQWVLLQCDGTQWLGLTGGSISFPLLAPNGTVAAPSYSFAAATGTGMYSDGTNLLMAVGGTEVFLSVGSVSAVLGVLDVILTNATTAAADLVIEIDHNSSGTPAAGFGSVTKWRLKDSTTQNTNAADLTVTWATATHASRKARAVLNVYDTAAREVMRGEASGSAAMVGFLGAAGAVRQTGDVGAALVTFGLMSGTPTGTNATASLTADFTDTTGALANLSDLTLTLAAGQRYVGQLVFRCNNSAPLDGIQLDFNGGTATMTSFWAAASISISGGTDTIVGSPFSSSLGGAIAYSVLTGETLLIVQVSLVVNAGGTFIPRAAENSHTTGTLTVELGSYLTLMPSAN